VIADGFRADADAPGDLLVAEAGGDVLEAFEFAPDQPRIARQGRRVGAG